LPAFLISKKNRGTLMRSPCCLCVCESPPPINFWMPEPILMKLRYHNTWTNFNGVLHKFLPSICVSVCVFPYRC
jgi:hypothetical protein